MYSKTNNEEEVMNLKERREHYVKRLGRKKGEEKCNSITISKKNNKKSRDL